MDVRPAPKREGAGAHMRLLGALLALIVVLVTLLALSGLDPAGPGFQVVPWDMGLSACMAGLAAGLLVGPRAARPGLPLLALVEMTVLSYVLFMVLFPIVSILMSLPAATNGGAIYCWRPHVGDVYDPCPSGFYGESAIAATVSELGTIAFFLPIAMALLAELMFIPLVLAIVWVVLLRLAVD